MRNADVARVMEEIGGLMRFRGDNPFKIRAYENAAQAIRVLDEPLESLLAEGRLRSIPGGGAAIEKKIADYAATGSVPLHDKLLAETPLGVLELLAVPGLGPRRARAAYKEAGIDSLDALEAAAMDGTLATISGFGPKSVDAIVAALGQVRKHAGRHLGYEARALAEILAGRLRARDDVAAAEVAGELRRAVEIVEDVVLVAAADDPGPVIDGFCDHPMTAEVLSRPKSGGKPRSAKGSRGAKKSTGARKGRALDEPEATVRLGGGLIARLVVVPPDAFGAALVVETGSPEHVAELREIGKKKKRVLESSGLVGPRGARVATPAESDVYEALGLAFVPPELREGGGEVDAARHQALPNLVERADLRGLVHIHTTWSDGRVSIEGMATAARERGFSYIVVCDHSRSTSIAGGLSVDDLRRQIDEVRRVNDAMDGIEILAGSEVDILADGALDFPDDVLAELDCVVASVHAAFRLSRAEQTARMVRALANPWLDIVGHPTGRRLLSRDGIDVDMDAVLDAAAEHGVALEVNGDPHRLDLDWRWHRPATDRGILLSIDPDAHRISEIEELLASGIEFARKGWVTAEQTLNARTLAKFRAALRRNR
jgi:DNA polymerase (family 10)